MNVSRKKLKNFLRPAPAFKTNWFYRIMVLSDFFKFRKFSYAHKGDLKVAPTLGDAIIGKIPMSYLNGRDNVAEAFRLP